MNAKKRSFLLLILVAVACTNRSTSSEQDEVRHWNNVLQQDVYKRQLRSMAGSVIGLGRIQQGLGRDTPFIQAHSTETLLLK